MTRKLHAANHFKRSVLLFLAAALFAPAALAQRPDSFYASSDIWYYKAEIARLSLSDGYCDLANGISCEDTGIGISGWAGYKFTNEFSLETGALVTSGYDVEEQDSSSILEPILDRIPDVLTNTTFIYILRIGGRYAHPVTGRFYLAGRAGLHYTGIEHDLISDNQLDEQGGFNPYFGAEALYKITDRASLFGNYTAYPMGEFRADVMAVGLEWESY